MKYTIKDVSLLLCNIFLNILTKLHPRLTLIISYNVAKHDIFYSTFIFICILCRPSTDPAVKM